MKTVLAHYKYEPQWFNGRIMFTHKLAQKSKIDYPERAYFSDDEGKIITNDIIAVKYQNNWKWEVLKS